MIYATHLFAMFSLISAVLYWYFKLNQLDQSIRFHFSTSICICFVILGILIAIWLTLWSSYQFKQQLPHSFSLSLSQPFCSAYSTAFGIPKSSLFVQFIQLWPPAAASSPPPWFVVHCEAEHNSGDAQALINFENDL